MINNTFVGTLPIQSSLTNRTSLINEGGRIFENIFGLGYTLVARNITPHPELGIGDWTNDEIKRAITQGISRDGRQHLAGMAYPYYATITDEDLDAIIVYLRSVDPSPTD